MAKTNNLTDFLTDLANAIRTKDGSSASINPQDFANRIKNLPSNSTVESYTCTFTTQERVVLMESNENGFVVLIFRSTTLPNNEKIVPQIMFEPDDPPLWRPIGNFTATGSSAGAVAIIIVAIPGLGRFAINVNNFTYASAATGVTTTVACRGSQDVSIIFDALSSEEINFDCYRVLDLN